MTLKHIFIFLLSSFLSFTTQTSNAEDLISAFPLDKYDQRISSWIKPTDNNYDKPLLTPELQKQHQEKFFNHYFGNASPWSAEYVNKILQQAAPNDLKSVEQLILNNLSNQDKAANEIGYGDNFRPYSSDWLLKISTNINLTQFDHFSYNANNRAIAVDNLLVRVLPTTDVHFYDYKLAGQGYPFDNLQMTSVWAGTPLYVLGETEDHEWSFVITPEVVAWVQTKGIARVDNEFVTRWTNAAKQNLAAIIKTKTSILDDNNEFLFSAYIGSVFPASEHNNEIKIMIPVKDANHRALIKYTILTKDQASMMPLPLTPHNMATVMSTLINRHYGWGNMYFNNDCSAETKNLFTPFGIWIPRHSSDQVTVSKMVDMTSSSALNRLSYLQRNGKAFLTLVYIGGHVVLYVGNYPNPNSSEHEMMAMTYQNIWGLSPLPASRRAVIGQSVLFPMLLQYPEDASLNSLANKKYFQVAYLDEAATTPALHTQFFINLRKMMGLGELPE